MRVVSLLPSITEICYLLGLDDDVAAVTHECDFPAAARSKPHATRNVLPPGLIDGAEIDRLVSERVRAGLPIYEIDVPLLERLAPDLILTQELCDVCAVSYQDVLAVARQLPKQPSVESIEPNTVAEIIASIGRIGRLTGRDERALLATRELLGRIDYIRRIIETAEVQRPRVVCLEWLDPLMVGGHWVPEMVELAGGRDVLGVAGQPARYVEIEEVIAVQPEVLVLMPCGYDLTQTLAQTAHFAALTDLQLTPALANGRVYAVDGSGYFNRPGPRLIDGIEILAAIFHPDLFGDRAPDAAFASVSSARTEQSQ